MLWKVTYRKQIFLLSWSLFYKVFTLKLKSSKNNTFLSPPTWVSQSCYTHIYIWHRLSKILSPLFQKQWNQGPEEQLKFCPGSRIEQIQNVRVRTEFYLTQECPPLLGRGEGALILLFSGIAGKALHSPGSSNWDLENLFLFYDVMLAVNGECSVEACPFFIQALGTGKWGVSSHQQLLPTSASHIAHHHPPWPRPALGRVKVPEHRTGGGTWVTLVLQTDAAGGCAYFKGLFLFFSQ